MIFPLANQCWEVVAPSSLEQNVFVAATMEQIGDALVSGSTSTTVAIATYEGEEVNVVITDLRQKGYTVTNDGTNLTISWGPQS